MAEALRILDGRGEVPINNFALMQGALDSRAYDVNAPVWPRFQNPAPFPSLPPTRRYFGRASVIDGAVTGTIVNFNNPDDYALATGTYLGLETNWEKNNADLKPVRRQVSSSGISEVSLYARYGLSNGQAVWQQASVSLQNPGLPATIHQVRVLTDDRKGVGDDY